MKFRAHTLLSKAFLPKLDPTNEEITHLKTARSAIREKIRSAFKEIHHSITQDDTGKHFIIEKSSLPTSLIESIRKLDSNQKKALRNTIPKFSPQGSFVYKTINRPCHNPPQQIDFDDGVYLPTDLFEDRPIVSKDLFFKIVDDALTELCSEQNGWRFDNSKPTCARVVLDQRKHIDIPLYAIPREQYEQMSLEALNKSVLDEAIVTHKLLNSEDVFIARRDQLHWIKSDPKLVSQWFLGAIEDFDEILRRVCRYLKAWRDNKFTTGGPSSITLMACAVETFQQNSKRGHIFRDDSEALLACATNLFAQLEKGVQSPIDETEPNLFPRDGVSQEERQRILEITRDLGTGMKSALLHANSASEANTKLLSLFGTRFPFAPEAIEVTASAAVLSAKPKPQPQPEVKNMSGG